VIDGTTSFGAPGLVDLQTNGVGAVAFWTADPDGWRAAGATLLTSGVATYLPTLPSGPLDAYDAALDRAIEARDDAAARRLPQIAGVHLEGPFLGDAPGAHPTELLRPMDVDWLLARVERHPDLIRLVTLAPEADPTFDGIRALRDAGVVRSERRGTWIHYALEGSVLGALGALIADLAPARISSEASAPRKKAS